LIGDTVIVAELDRPVQPLSGPPVVLRAVVGIDDQRMRALGGFGYGAIYPVSPV